MSGTISSKEQRAMRASLGLPDKRLPSTVQQGKNFIKAVGDHALTGFKNADEHTIQSRQDTCRACEHLRGDLRCTHCGCYMLVKSQWESSKCPDGRW